MIRKVITYPRFVGPIRTWKEMSHNWKEMEALPGYKELQRENARLAWTLIFWMTSISFGIAYCLGKLLNALGLNL